MIAPSRTFQPHHPWLTILSLTVMAALAAGLMSLPVWGWIELRFSPVQRHYLPVYVRSEVVPVQSPKPAAPATKPSRSAAPKPQRAKVQSKPQPAPSSPFGKPVAEGESERKWDISQWID